jgi:hypothetical protein
MTALSSESQKKAQQAETFFGVSSWMVCSVGMMLANKLAITAFPLECMLTGFQMIFSVVVLLIFARRSLHFGSFWDVARWSMVTPFYAGMLLSSILALKNAPMTLIIVLRSLSPLFSLVVEQFYPNPLEVSKFMILSIAIILVGTMIYASDLDRTNLVGVQWCFLNMFLAVADRLLQRIMLAKDQCPVDISKTGVTLLNNLFALVPILALAVWKGEFAHTSAVLSHLNHVGEIAVIASCLIGLGISYTGIWAQSLISATSFLVLVNANKFVIILIEALFMRTKTLTNLQIFASVITIAGGVAYGKAREEIEERKDDDPALKSETDPLLPQGGKPCV